MVVRTRQVRQHGLAKKSMCRTLAAALAMLVCIAVPTAGSALAAPASTSSEVPVPEVNLGGGTYRVTASVFAEGTDGQVGTQASSGHWIQANDNLVALPACTESSCPWVPVGTGVEGAYGPQTECAEADGLCWVEIVSDTTGECTVAPVHDRGPLFVRDNWWASQSLREYNVPQGTPAAEYARDGTNFGFGAGISDAGHDIRNVYTYAAGIDLAEGTWNAIGLPTSAGISTVTVTMLWQAGITHDEACGNAPDPEPTPNPTVGNATVIDGTLNLRSGPSYSASIVTTMPGDSRVTVTGGSQSGFYPLTFNGTTGWALGTYLDIDPGEDPGSDDDDPPPTGETATVIDGELNLRSSASTSGSVLMVMPDGATVSLTGQNSNGFLSVSYQGTSGWAYAIYLSTEDDPPPSNGGTATVIDGSLNLRASASTSAGIVTVMPDGATVTLSGQTSNGFSQVTYNGSTGWAYSIYLSTGGDDDGGSGNGTFATVFDGALNMRSGASTGYSVVLVLPDGARVELTGSTSNGFAQVIYQGSTGWASSQWLTTGGSSGTTATVIDGALNLRASASTGSSVLTVMPDSATVTLLGQTSNGFSKVRYGGTEGWAYSAYLQ